MRVALYSRVSTIQQSREGVSLETQEQLARDRCAALGWSLAVVYTDVMSGRKDDRPELKRLLEDAKAGKLDAVFVYRLDRLGRSLVRTLQVVGELADAGVRLVSLTQPFEIDGSLGKLMLSIYASFAEMESEAIGARVRDARRQRVQVEGKHYSVPPFGYKRVEGRTLVDESQAPHVTWAFDQTAAGRGLRSLVAELNQAGVRTRTGHLWTATSLKVMLSNPTYKGYLSHGRKRVSRNSKGKVMRQTLGAGEYLLVKGDHEPLVSEVLWATVQGHLDARKGTAPRRAGAGDRVPWLAVSRCGVCGARLVARHRHPGATQFSCSRKDRSGNNACSLSSISMSLLSGALVRAMAVPLAPGMGASGRRKPKPKATDPSAMIAKIEAQIERESDLYRIGAQNLATTEAKVKSLRAQIEAVAVPSTPSSPPPRIEDLIALWRGLPDEDRAGLVRSLTGEVVLNEDTISLTWRPEFQSHLGEGLTVERPKLKGVAASAFALG